MEVKHRPSIKSFATSGEPNALSPDATRLRDDRGLMNLISTEVCVDCCFSVRGGLWRQCSFGSFPNLSELPAKTPVPGRTRQVFCGVRGGVFVWRSKIAPSLPIFLNLSYQVDSMLAVLT